MDHDDQPQEQRPKLKSLAQAARGKNLNSARGLLIAVGVLTIVINGIQLFFIRDEVRKAMVQPGQIANPLPQQAEDIAVMIAYGIIGGAMALGVLFVVFGVLVKQFPVPITIMSLVLYLGATAFFALLNPATLLMGIIFKVVIVISLVKAIQSAFAYQKEQTLEAAQARFADEYN